MARYVGDYESDSSKQFPRVALSVGFVEVTRGEIQGQFEVSSEADDRRYLPELWFSNTDTANPRLGTCRLPHTPRYALLWVTNTLYLRVPVFWRPGTTLYNQFFIALAFDFENSLVSLGQRGEVVSSNWLRVYTK
jgi:hypothetical protein